MYFVIKKVAPLFYLFTHFCCLVTKLCPTLCASMDCSKPGFPVLYCFPEFAQIHIH